jgi:hypothetical protein
VGHFGEETYIVRVLTCGNNAPFHMFVPLSMIVSMCFLHILGGDDVLGSFFLVSIVVGYFKNAHLYFSMLLESHQWHHNLFG